MFFSGWVFHSPSNAFLTVELLRRIPQKAQAIRDPNLNIHGVHTLLLTGTNAYDMIFYSCYWDYKEKPFFFSFLIYNLVSTQHPGLLPPILCELLLCIAGQLPRYNSCLSVTVNFQVWYLYLRWGGQYMVMWCRRAKTWGLYRHQPGIWRASRIQFRISF